MIEELNRVVLTHDLPEKKLKAGDIGTVVMAYGDAAYEVEFTTASGETFALETLRVDEVRLARADEVSHVREIA
jgi:hypothetical protein